MDGLSFTTFLKLTLMPTTQGKLNTLHKMMSSSDGYDFYKRLKMAAREVASNPKKADAVFAALATIKKDAERNHNVLMAKRFLSWWQDQAGAVAQIKRPSGAYKMPEMAFNVRLRPELVHRVADDETVTYLWATKLPRLRRQTAAAGLLMLRRTLGAGSYKNSRFQILDLRQEVVHTEDIVTNLAEDHLAADIALVNAIWISAKPMAA
jgi:hypothetical protein